MLSYFETSIYIVFLDIILVRMCQCPTIPSLEILRSVIDATATMESHPEGKLSKLQIATAVAVSFAICKAGTSFTRFLRIQGADLPAITAIVVLLATIFPTHFRQLAPTGDAIAIVLMQVCLLSITYITNKRAV